MVILGLTGSIGMGKSETARMFRREGIPVYDADKEVHNIMAPGGLAVPEVDAAFPGVVTDGAIDRQELGKRVFGKPEELRKLEGIIHPLVRKVQLDFLKQASRRRERLVVLDIPLLFETGGERRVDKTVVVSAPLFLQRQRVLSRPGMSVEKFEQILEQQVPDAEKRRRADFIVPSGLGLAVALREVRRIITLMRQEQGEVWPDRVLSRL